MRKSFFISTSIFRTFSTFFTAWRRIISFITFIKSTIAFPCKNSSFTFNTFRCSKSWRSSSRTYSTFFRFLGRIISAWTLITFTWSNSRIIHPVEQSKQYIELVVYVPAGQERNYIPSGDAYFPLSHSLQIPLSAYLPAGHSWQLVVPLSDVVPWRAV